MPAGRESYRRHGPLRRRVLCQPVVDTRASSRRAFQVVENVARVHEIAVLYRRLEYALQLCFRREAVRGEPRPRVVAEPAEVEPVNLAGLPEIEIDGAGREVNGAAVPVLEVSHAAGEFTGLRNVRV